MRAWAVLLCWVAVIAVVDGCGGSDSGGSKAPPAGAPAPVDEAPGGPIGRVALSAARVADPRDCPRWFEAGQGVAICRDYVTAGSRQAQARLRSVTRTGSKAVANMAEPGGNPFALSLRRRDGKWRVYDEAGFLPAAGG
jgi:hypothetical protein